MQVGSLVECLKDFVSPYIQKGCIPIHFSPVPKKGDVFVVEEIGKHGGLHLEGVITRPRIPFTKRYFREIQPPMIVDINELIKQPLLHETV